MICEARYVDRKTNKRYIKFFKDSDEAYRFIVDNIELKYSGVVLIIPKKDVADIVMAWGSNAIDYHPDLIARKDIEISYQHIY